MENFPFLSVLTLTPLVGAVIVALLPVSAAKDAKGRNRADEAAKWVALVISLLVFVGTMLMFFAFDKNGDRFQFTEDYTWIPSFGTEFAFGVDGIALVMLALIALLVPIVILASWHDGVGGKRSVKTFFALMLALETCMIGVFAVTDVLLFYVFFEAMLVPMYFLIASYGGPRRQYAAVKFFLYSLVGGLFMLAAVIGVYVVSTDQLGDGTFSFEQLTQLDIDPTTQRWLFLGFFIAFAIKAPLVPFHTWLPDAGGQAPIGAAVLLVGVLDKVGTYGMLRYCLPLFPDAAVYFAPWIVGISVAGIIYGALLAIGQSDMKRLVAYTSIAHFGFIALGVFAFTSQAGTGAVLYMVNHGLSTGALFLVVGFLINRRKSSQVADFGGAGKVVPWIAGAFLIAGLSSLALPGTNSFVSEFLVLVGSFATNKAATVIATIGIVFAALYILWLYQRTMQGKLNPEMPKMRDISLRESVVIAPVLVLIVAMGFYPKPVIDVITPAVNFTMNDIDKKDPAPEARDEARSSEEQGDEAKSGAQK
ncbi:MAG: NADH-quinone oxidoreductase subunit M [Corynebacteriales bacterium]|nr:NADH-quinone oxidoreductase subunit M [Mycobacteriales bacterium]